jgi:hypothetical protein
MPKILTTHDNSDADYFLLATGFCENRERLQDKAFLTSLLRELPNQIGMTAISEPTVSVASNNPGLEGYVPIDLSNLTISTYVNNSRLVACIHSCKEFDFQAVLYSLKTWYGCSSVKYMCCSERDFREKL